jgi:hypothetical protein
MFLYFSTYFLMFILFYDKKIFKLTESVVRAHLNFCSLKNLLIVSEGVEPNSANKLTNFLYNFPVHSLQLDTQFWVYR